MVPDGFLAGGGQDLLAGCRNGGGGEVNGSGQCWPGLPAARQLCRSLGPALRFSRLASWAQRLFILKKERERENAHTYAYIQAEASEREAFFPCQVARQHFSLPFPPSAAGSLV